MNDLKPCPFCGSYAVVIERKCDSGERARIIDNVFFRVVCIDCGCRTGWSSGLRAEPETEIMQAAVLKWNRRNGNEQL